MYTMVMMMAATSGGDAVAFGRNRGCDGGNCHGAAVVATAPASCHGSGVGSCHGSSSCHGGSGFLGLRGKLFGGRGCTGSTVSSCHGGVATGSCHGGAVVSGGCHGAVVTGCVPTVGTVGGGVVTMPMVPGKKEEPKKEEPKKEEPKKEAK